MIVRINESVGRFYLGRSDRQYQVSIIVTDDDGKQWSVCGMWPEDDAKDLSGMPPSEVAIEILERLKAYLFKSDRDETIANVERITANAEAFDAAWASGEIKKHQQAQARAYQAIDALRRAYL